ncbi:uncharacterized protein LOC126694452 [Quercus robur]|uniref:uncharacterized protein LOC126694452 n=1 Tax=Quercus robur TaxID=38942 RepID=UPI00216341A8|nr:uncharacterized protein LOC126694452 [Quercus robur]
MGETGLFAVAQSLVMMKGLLDRCLNRESTLDRVRAKAQQTEEELGQLQRWRSKMEKKLELSEQARKELEEKTATSLTVIENKEAEIKQLKEELRQAKVAAVEEYRCSESCLGELSDSFLQGFDDSLRQVKKAYPELDLTMVKLEDQAQTSALPFLCLIDTKTRNRRSRETSIWKAIENGAETLFDIVAEVYSGFDRSVWIPAASNVRLHVKHLAEQDKLPKIQAFSIQKFQKTCGLYFLARWIWAYLSKGLQLNYQKLWTSKLFVAGAAASFAVLYSISSVLNKSHKGKKSGIRFQI